jgi:hypothetical protein
VLLGFITLVQQRRCQKHQLAELAMQKPSLSLRAQQLVVRELELAAAMSDMTLTEPLLLSLEALSSS